MTARETLLVDLLRISEELRGAFTMARQSGDLAASGQLLEAGKLIGSAIGKLARAQNDLATTTP